MKKLEFIKKTILPVLLSVTMISSTSLADGTNRQSQISSHGAVDITSGDGSVLIDSEDMKTLANETDTLESIYKTRLQQAVNRLNTFIQPDGSITHKKEASGNQMTLPSFDLLASAITNSQSSSTAIADLSGTNYYKTNEGKINTSGSGTSVSLGAASADNLSAGKIAFVDGTLLLGTGSDNESYFNQGYTSGKPDGQSQKSGIVSVNITKHSHSSSCYSTINCTVTRTKTGNKQNRTCSGCAGAVREFVEIEFVHSNPLCPNYKPWGSGARLWKCTSHSKSITGSEDHTTSVQVCPYSDGQILKRTLTFLK